MPLPLEIQVYPTKEESVNYTVLLADVVSFNELGEVNGWIAENELD
jgi:hypothetical protein